MWRTEYSGKVSGVEKGVEKSVEEEEEEKEVEWRKECCGKLRGEGSGEVTKGGGEKRVVN